MERVQLWSCGGGRQSAGIAAMICQGILPKPDHISMVRLEGEIQTTWRYVDTYIRPAMESLGIPFTAINRADYATKDFWGGADGDSILLPVYTDQSGVLSKLPEYCSGEWKREVGARWAAEQLGWKNRGVDIWLGISLDEAGRRRGARKQWLQPVYPLLDMAPKNLASCLAAVDRQGWPEPPRSRCHFCPNQSDREWAELTAEEWDAACDLDEEIRQTDPHAYLHKKMIPLRTVILKKDEPSLFTGGCSAGMCV